MRPTALELPARASKPRVTGLTMMVDGGLPTRNFQDIVESGAEYLDFVKFGWGTAIVTNDLRRKIDFLTDFGIDYYFGGTLFEKFVLQDRFDDYRELCHSYGCGFVEVSNGTISLSSLEKVGYIRKLADDFAVVSEVGFKDAERSERLAPNRWIEDIHDDIAAGAFLVTLEARESGRSGSAARTASFRFGLIEEILASDLSVERLLFEAPSNELQCYFVRRIGTDVNLGNIPSTSILGLETIRLGLRSDTLECFDTRCREERAATSSIWPSRSTTWTRRRRSTSARLDASWRGATPTASRSTSSVTSWCATWLTRPRTLSASSPCTRRHFGVTFREGRDFDALYDLCVQRKIEFFADVVSASRASSRRIGRSCCETHRTTSSSSSTTRPRMMY